ncbi:PAB-dependent poly(A)-specific ribonuclease subunit 3 [Malassezia sp. CBS 17886]|nr:PAB-dependent poly(A)-specific ribonuclease subunit 3 [Malassezia sp. CBS 17886]
MRALPPSRIRVRVDAVRGAVLACARSPPAPVAVAFSGSRASWVLLHALHRILRQDAPLPRTRVPPARAPALAPLLVFYVAGGAEQGGTRAPRTEEDEAAAAAAATAAPDATFVRLSLDDVFVDGATHDHLDDTRVRPEAPPPPASPRPSSFTTLLTALAPPHLPPTAAANARTCTEDMRRIMRRHLLRKEAAARGCAALVYADDAVDRSARLLEEIAKGAGYKLPLACAPALWAGDVLESRADKTSIGTLSASLVSALQMGVPSTVGTIAGTGAKLVLDDEVEIDEPPQAPPPQGIGAKGAQLVRYVHGLPRRPTHGRLCPLCGDPAEADAAAWCAERSAPRLTLPLTAHLCYACLQVLSGGDVDALYGGSQGPQGEAAQCLPLPAFRKTPGTSLSNVFLGSNASLDTISFQPRAVGAGGQGGGTPAAGDGSLAVGVESLAVGDVPPAAGGESPAPGEGLQVPAALRAHIAEAPVFVPRIAADAAPAEYAEGGAGGAPYGSPVDAYAHVDHAYDGGGGGAHAPPAPARHPLQYHLYAPPQPHVSNLHPAQLASMAFFMDPGMREEMQRRQEALFTGSGPGGGPPLPETVHVYHDFVPLEPGARDVPPALVDPRFATRTAVHTTTGAAGDPSRVFGYPSHVYKATCALDGRCYVLRQISGVHLPQENAMAAVQRWRKLRHPSLVAVREAFTTPLVFVYDYHPLATTLYAEHMTVKPLQQDRRTGRLQSAPMHVPERVLWSYISQLAALLRVVHSGGLAARSIEPSKVLRTNLNRIRLSGCAVFDVLMSGGQPDLAAQQRADFVALGRLILCTGCHNGAAASTPQESMAKLRGTYSASLTELVDVLLDADAPDSTLTANKLLTRIAPHLADEIGAALGHDDLLESSLQRELENARLVRLMCRMNAVVDRPDLHRDSQWAETGDRYVVRLFRDMVFHSIDEHGQPVLDLSHILVHLNKLDAGIDEKIMLVSRDELSCLVVSYGEVKRCLEAATHELASAQS